MDNPEKLATLSTNTRRRQKHNTKCVGHHYVQTNTYKTKIRHEPSHKQLEGKDEPNIVFMRKSQRTSQQGTHKHL